MQLEKGPSAQTVENAMEWLDQHANDKDLNE